MRLIDADSLKEDLRLYFTDEVLDGVSAKLAFHQIMHDIDNAPTVDKGYNEGHIDGMLKAEKLYARPIGEWRLDDTEQFCYCSNCEDTFYPRPLDPSWNYCPHCGAKMKGAVE